jgi:hypothetical protein
MGEDIICLKEFQRRRSEEKCLRGLKEYVKVLDVFKLLLTKIFPEKPIRKPVDGFLACQNRSASGELGNPSGHLMHCM